MSSGEQPVNQAAEPTGIVQTRFCGPDVTPSPACLAVAPSGEVFVGVDGIGSLGKEEGRGRIVRLVDTDADGVADENTVFATVNNPRGILPVGDSVYVLHTTFSEETHAASGMVLVAFEDLDHDGVADGPPRPLITNISSAQFVAERGTDHATNGIRMGIDGWIYIAVGDFGFHDAVDASGKRMTQLGGGVLRVRPNGTETEVYTHGLRNIYDVAIDPYMNVFTRGNTNDGGGWNVRFTHHIQSAEYGYPSLFKHFTEEIAPALADVGGGSGTGAYFIHDPRWPEGLNHVPVMADWGRSKLFLHRVAADGPSFTQQEVEFLDVSQVTDVDMDASGRMYLSAWDNAGYYGSSEHGFVSRATPAGWTMQAYEPSNTVDLETLELRLRSESSVARLDASQELLTRPKEAARALALAVAKDTEAALYVRVAGIFTYAQIAGIEAVPELVELTQQSSVREFALRALGDRRPFQEEVPVEPFLSGLKDESSRVRAAATIALGRTRYSKPGVMSLLRTPAPASFVAPVGNEEGPHATPNADILLAHLAVRSLVALDASADTLASFAATDSAETPTLALWAMRYMHSDRVVAELTAALSAANGARRTALLETLARLYFVEAEYDGSWWWNTRPDTHGPYYKPVKWSGSVAIEASLTELWNNADPALRAELGTLSAKHRLDVASIELPSRSDEDEALDIDLEAIASGTGEVAASSIEEVMLALAELTPDLARGEQLFSTQGCVACHTLTANEKPKGPYMGQVGSIMSPEQIAESILRPNASISQGFASVMVTKNDGSMHVGFISDESSTEITLRDIAGNSQRIAQEDIQERQDLENSMMPEGLGNNLDLKDFASLVGFLAQQTE